MRRSLHVVTKSGIRIVPASGDCGTSGGAAGKGGGGIDRRGGACGEGEVSVAMTQAQEGSLCRLRPVSMQLRVQPEGQVYIVMDVVWNTVATDGRVNTQLHDEYAWEPKPTCWHVMI